jgi:hypothetical protein
MSPDQENESTSDNSEINNDNPEVITNESQDVTSPTESGAEDSTSESVVTEPDTDSSSDSTESSQSSVDEPAPEPAPIEASSTDSDSSEDTSPKVEPTSETSPDPISDIIVSKEDTSSVSVEPATEETGSNAVVAGDAATIASVSTSNGKPPKKFLKGLLIALLAVVIIGGGSAAAYEGVIVPNKPANVLKTSLVNSLQEKEANFSGTVQAQINSGIAYKIAYSGAEDSSTKSSDIKLNLTVSGVVFPVEARLVGGNIYIKVGDLSDIASLVKAYSPSASTIVSSLSSQVSNKWFEVDSTLIDEAGSTSCVLNTNLSLTKADVQLLEDQYGKNPFATIDSSSNVTLNGVKTEEFVLSINDNKLAPFAKGLNNLSIVKSLESCDKGTTPTSETSSLADNDTTPLTIWVNKSTKRIVQISSHSTTQDKSKSGVVASGTVDLNYSPVSITAPQNAEPVTQLISSLETSLGGSSVDPSSLFGQ